MHYVNDADIYAGHLQVNISKCITCIDRVPPLSTCNVSIRGLAFSYVDEYHVTDGD